MQKLLKQPLRVALLLLVAIMCPVLTMAQTTGEVTMKTNIKPGGTIKLKVRTADKKLNFEGITGKWVNGQNVNFKVGDNQTITLRGQISELTCNNCQLTEVNFKDCNKLTEFYANSNNIKKLDLTPCEIIRVVSCNTNKIEEVNAQGRAKLTRLFCGENKIKKLNIEGCTSLLKLYLYTNELESLDVSQCTKLTDLSCFNNHLTKLDISHNKNLNELYCSNNKIEELNITDHKNLSVLYCFSNKIKMLDVKDHANISELNCGDNLLTELDLTGVNSMIKLNCSDNKIEKLDLTGKMMLAELGCQGNRLAKLEVAQLKSLQSIACGDNLLTELNVKDLAYLGGLSCEGNRLKALDLTGCKSLAVLVCARNAIQGKAMQELVASLPDRNNQVQGGGELDIYCDTALMSHRNVFTKQNATNAGSKAWIPKELKEMKKGKFSWEPYAGVETYAVTVKEPDNGTIVLKDNRGNTLTSEDLKAMGQGTEITVEATPAPNHELSQLLVNNGNIMPATTFFVEGATVVSAIFEAQTGVSHVEATTAQVKAIYNLNGQQLNALQRGINICQMTDGTVKKVVVR